MCTLSVIIITKNAAATITTCLESIKWANEIIVLDSGSTDNTVLLCQHYTDKVYVMDWPGYGIQKNRALAKASCDWVFSIDADEWLTPAASDEVQQAMQNSNYIAYRMQRRNMYFSQVINYGDVGRDIVTRLFKRGYGKFSEDIVHEHTIINGPTGHLQQALMHHSYRNLEDLITRMNYYTTLSAQARFQQNKKSSLRKAITHSIWAFIKSYILRLGFLDGRMGFIIAVSSAESSYYRYIKLLLMHYQPDIHSKEAP